MKFTKVIALLIAAMMVISLFSCTGLFGEEETTESASTSGETTGNTTEVTTEQTTEGGNVTTEETTDGTDEYNVISIAEAIVLCGESGNVTEERYYIRGIIDSVTNAEYGGMVISDSTGTISVYGTYSADGELRYSELAEKPYKGDEVLLYCILQNYNGTPEIQNARLIEFKSNQGNVDVSEYTAATIAQARAAETGAKLKVSGIVARITYANGMKPSGFILVDGADSIYVYDGDAAARVAIGNRVEIAASKTYWILDTEQGHAATFGYKGCNQLEGATVISIDDSTSEWINSDIPSTTVKAIMDNPVSNDITTQVYKVTALVKKVPGNGFVNYYIDDLDGVTGSYAYTQCNGSDFKWLDEFDGKICTVYLVVLNAKSTASGCVYRFLPLAVINENFTFNIEDTPEFAVKYHGVDQFESSYSGNPALELTTSVSSDLLGFENATLSYKSSDESVIKIETVDGKTVMNCLASGTATITVTATYNGKEYSENVTVKVNFPTEEIPAVSVKDAIDAELGTEVTVKGIVGPSLANQKGFYLIDDSGVIAIRMNVDVLATLHIGDEIIVKGQRILSKDTDGQICIDKAELLQNNYGDHPYSTASFIKDKTVADIINLDGDVSHTVEVYVVTASVTRESGGYSTNTYVVDGDNKFMLYSGGTGNYAWLDNYTGQTLEIEVAVCDWNNKGNKGCILSIKTADGTQIFNTLNVAE